MEIVGYHWGGGGGAKTRTRVISLEKRYAKKIKDSREIENCFNNK